jgi:hypothetical protein
MKVLSKWRSKNLIPEWKVHYRFFYDPELVISAIVNVQKVSNYVHQNNSLQANFNCLAINDVGFVFNIEIAFNPDSTEK